MTHPTTARQRLSESGFTLIEALIIITIIGILATVTAPEIALIVNKNKFIGLTRDSSTMVQKARMQAIHKGRKVFVVFDDGRREVRATVDGGDEIGKFPIPGFVSFEAPPTQNVVEDLEVLADPPLEVQMVFNPDGSVERVGAVRFADSRMTKNYLELRVGPTRAVPQIRTRKWNGTAWQAKGEGEGYGGWTWH